MKKLYSINGCGLIPDTISYAVRRHFIRDGKQIDLCADDEGKLYLLLNLSSYDVQDVFVPIEQDAPYIYFQKVDLYTEQIQFLKANADAKMHHFHILKDKIEKFMPNDGSIYRVIINGTWGYCDIATPHLLGVFCNAKLVKDKTENKLCYPVGERIYGGAVELKLGYLTYSQGDIFI